LSNDIIRKRCIKLGIKTKSRKQSINDNEVYVDRPIGETHWSKTNPELLAKCAKASSERMTKNNPSNMAGVAEKTAKTNSIKYKGTPTFHEKLMLDLFDSFNIMYEFQPAISKYIPDFKIGNVLIEIDGRGHASRRATDIVRDKLLCGLGFYVVRINQDLLFNKYPQP
jgi:very-short-patch-repair endonuclease